MRTIALNRLNMLAVPQGNGLSTAQKMTIVAEFTRMGYRLTNPEMLDQVSEAFLLDYAQTVRELETRRGGNVAYVPLFRNFPNIEIDDVDYFFKRIVGYIANVSGWLNDKNSVLLENGNRIPTALFDLAEFSADPITQTQSKELWDRHHAEQNTKAGDDHTEWIDLTLAFDGDVLEALREFLCRMLYAKSSIKEALHAEVYELLQVFDVTDLDKHQIVFKETRALVMKHYWTAQNWDAVAHLGTSATDILRMFAAVTETDVGLSTKIRFPKMNRGARKAILSVLENSFDLPGDLRRYSRLWLEVGRYLHPSEYANQFPRTAEVFDALRNGKIETFQSKTEQLMAMGKVYNLLLHLETKPGTFARKLHEVLRRFPESMNSILHSFEQHAEQLPLKNLLMLQSYFRTINDAVFRTVVNKKGKVKAMLNTSLGAFNEQEVKRIVAVFDRLVTKSLAQRESWSDQKVWIDHALINYTVPLQQRKASDGIITVGRGSRIPVDLTKVLRLFVYWKQTVRTTDLDLSVIQYDAGFNYQGHVSYTNLSAEGIVHSGDLQDAPHGAVEYVDITLSKVPKQVRYLAVQVHKYCGENFVEMQCHAGWSMRTVATNDRRTFDVKTVVNKFDLNGVGGYCVPIVVDLHTQEMIMTDLYVSGRDFHNTVEGSLTDVAVMCSQVAEFINTRPTMAALAEQHAISRNAQLVDTREEADITFGVEHCTYNATSVEQILAELL